jgi:transcriptional regulator with PAS, ATPase and Fis domain
LAVIQDQEITRVGDVYSKKVDVRIIAATNQDLESMVKKGKFRDDLFYRLNVVPVFIPPLRERKEELPFLLAHFVSEYNKKYKSHTRLSKEAVDILSVYRWPGNIRELANLIEHLIIVVNEPLIKPEHLPGKYTSEGDGLRNISDDTPKSLRKEISFYEIALIKKTLASCHSHEEAAHRLGISLSTLTRRLRQVKYDSQN